MREHPQNLRSKLNTTQGNGEVTLSKLNNMPKIFERYFVFLTLLFPKVLPESRMKLEKMSENLSELLERVQKREDNINTNMNEHV